MEVKLNESQEVEKKVTSFFVDLNIITEQLDEQKKIEELTPTVTLVNVLDELISVMEKKDKEFDIREFVAPFKFKPNGEPDLSYAVLDPLLIELIMKNY